MIKIPTNPATVKTATQNVVPAAKGISTFMAFFEEM
jgi:hypothetical protein